MTTERGAVAGPPWREIARWAREAYLMNLHAYATSSSAWDNLPAEQRNAWEAAVRQAVELAQRQGEIDCDVDVSRWRGWVAPHLREGG